MATNGGEREFAGYDAIQVELADVGTSGFVRVFPGPSLDDPLFAPEVTVLTCGQSENAAWFHLRTFAFTSSSTDGVVTKRRLLEWTHPTCNDVDGLKYAVKLKNPQLGDIPAWSLKVYAHDATTGVWKEVTKPSTPLVANDGTTAYHVVVPK
jgi:hypothetical protein